MKVKELIEKLSQMDSEAVVLVDAHEDWNTLRCVWSKEEVEHPEKGLYFKGCSPEEVYRGSVNYVMLADERKI
jgi:hypothetical protein